MRQRNKQAPQIAEVTVRDIRQVTRLHFSAEEKIRIFLEGLRGEDSVSELCRDIDFLDANRIAIIDSKFKAVQALKAHGLKGASRAFMRRASRP